MRSALLILLYRNDTIIILNLEYCRRRLSGESAEESSIETPGQSDMELFGRFGGMEAIWEMKVDDVFKEYVQRISEIGRPSEKK